MPRRLLYGLGGIVLILCTAIIIWQGSFSGNFVAAPDGPAQTFTFYAISVLIFLLLITLGFMFARLMVKLWIERRQGRVGSRIRTKLVAGALALSLMPVFFMALFSFYVLSVTLQTWFDRPIAHELIDLKKIAKAVEHQTIDKANLEAEMLASAPETAALLEGSPVNPNWLASFCRAHGIIAVAIQPADSSRRAIHFGAFPGETGPPSAIGESRVATTTGVARGSVKLAIAVPVDITKEQQAIRDYDRQFDQMKGMRKSVRGIYLLLLALITLFVVFAITWLAQYLARQISGPISAVLQAAEEVSKGNLSYRVDVRAADELAQLVNAFNRMTSDLEANRAEIEARRRFTEAILESIPTGVISVDSGGVIQHVNEALAAIFPASESCEATSLEDLFAPEDAGEIRYLMNRARRTGHASRQLEIQSSGKTLHLSLTVSAIEGRRGSGYVIVIEDTSDLLRAQKAAAWSEVARRVAHEIRNPLTPITLSAERILRQAKRGTLPPAVDKMVRECAETILDETESVKRLVDEFSQFSRLPAAKPVMCQINDVVANGISVFEGRLEGIQLNVELAPGLPPVWVDPEQFKRVVVNLIDNAAEAMQDSPTKILSIQTRLGIADAVELSIADTGCGITPDQREKLFLPYFSTKGRGTGLGLAIVSHILAEHNANIRVEDNKPCGAWFIVEIPAMAEKESSPFATATFAV